MGGAVWDGADGWSCTVLYGMGLMGGAVWDGADGWSCTVLYGSTNTFIINLRTQRVSEGVQIAA